MINSKDVEKEMNSLVVEMDGEFNTVEKSVFDIKNSNKHLLDKVKRLETLGFSKALQKVDTIKKEVAKREEYLKELYEEKNFVDEYRIKFPGYKFIPERIFSKVLKKYDLYLGPVEAFTGDVPIKSIEDIERFSEGENVIYQFEVMGTNLYTHTYKCSIKSLPAYYNDERIVSKKLYINIAAPLNQFDTSNKDFKIDKKKRSIFEIPKKIDDPIVVQPVTGGYIIITAWDSEALDKDIMNPENN